MKFLLYAMVAEMGSPTLQILPFSTDLHAVGLSTLLRRWCRTVLAGGNRNGVCFAKPSPRSRGVADSRTLSHAATKMVDTQKANAEKASAGKAKAGHVRTAKVDAAKVDAAKVDAAKVDAAKVDAAKVDAAKVDAGKADAGGIHAENVDTARIECVDWDDVQGTLAGDAVAFERLVRRYQQPIADYLWRFTRDVRARDELVQDVFVEAYLSLKSYARRAPLLHWLKRLATRVGYRFWKHRRKRREVPLPDEADLTLATADHAESALCAADLVHSLLARLGDRDRLVMTLAYLEGCSVKETAELTGWTETMVRVQTHRARRRLAKICGELGVEL